MVIVVSYHADRWGGRHGARGSFRTGNSALVRVANALVLPAGFGLSRRVPVDRGYVGQRASDKAFVHNPQSLDALPRRRRLPHEQRRRGLLKAIRRG